MNTEFNSIKCRHMVNNEVNCDVTELVKRVTVLDEFIEDSSPCNQYLAVSEWLAIKLCAQDQKVTQFGGLHIWAREAITDDILYEDSVIQKIVNKIMIDHAKL